MKRDTMIIEKSVETVPTHGQVILFEQYRMFRRTWWWILALSLIAGAATAYYAFFIAVPEYKAVAVAAPPNKSGTPLDNLIGAFSSSLKDAAIGRLVGKSGSEFGYTRLALMGSRRVYDSLIDKYDLYSVYEIPKSRPDLMYGALADRIELEPQTEGPIVIGVYDPDPKRAADIANDIVVFTNSVSRDLNSSESAPITEYVGRRYEAVKQQYDSVAVALTAFMQKNKLFAPEQQGEIIGSAIEKAEAEIRKQRATVQTLSEQLGENDPRTQLEQQILTTLESQARSMAAGKGGVLPSPSLQQLPEAAVEYARLQVNFETNAKTLAILQPMYEQMKLEEVRNIPVVNLLDPAFPPPVKARPKRSVLVASALLGTFLVAYLIVALVTYIRGFLHRYRVYTSNNGTFVYTRRAQQIEESGS